MEEPKRLGTDSGAGFPLPYSVRGGPTVLGVRRVGPHPSLREEFPQFDTATAVGNVLEVSARSVLVPVFAHGPINAASSPKHGACPQSPPDSRKWGYRSQVGPGTRTVHGPQVDITLGHGHAVNRVILEQEGAIEVRVVQKRCQVGGGRD